MKTIDLGEKPPRAMKTSANTKWYPTINFSDNGVKGEPTLEEKRIGKTLKVTAHIRLTSISSRVDSPSNKLFDYSFEVRKIEMPEELAKHNDKK